MKFVLSWLKEFVPVKIPPEEIANVFTMAGLEVEAVQPLRDPQGAEDWLFEVNVTPNRGDCLSVRGLARELAAFTGEPLTNRPTAPAHGARPTADIQVDIREPSACARYAAAVVVDLEVGAPPGWLAYRLESCGIRSINNVVDVTNYVMLETGQPLHAFDLERLTAGSIVVRLAGARETIVTLDGVARELGAGDLLICDGDRPIALAGIMGGLESEVGARSKRVLIESARFDPATIRRTAKRLGLHTEASHRFERGVDPSGAVAALDRAAALLAEYAGGSTRGWVDRYPAPPRARAIELRPERVASLLGVTLDGGEIRRIFSALGLEVRDGEQTGAFQVMPPSGRSDLEREADLIEELARLYGYDRIPATLPALRVSGGKIDETSRREAETRALLAGAGLSEVVNLPFTSRRMNQLCSGLWAEAGAPVTVLNPVAVENAEMRLSLLPGLLENLRLNLAYKASSFFAYSLGKVFSTATDGAAERQSLAGILYGPRTRRGLRGREVPSADFFDCKGVVEEILELFALEHEVAYVRHSSPVFHPGRAARLLWRGKNLGELGQTHPDFCAEIDLPPCVLFELDFEGLVQYSRPRITFHPLPRFPSVERDFAVVVDEDFPAQRIVDWIRERGLVLIERVEVFDQYGGSPIPEGKKSLAYKVSYRAEDRTLTDAEVASLHQELVARIAGTFDAQLRS